MRLSLIKMCKSNNLHVNMEESFDYAVTIITLDDDLRYISDIISLMSKNYIVILPYLR